ncbi:MAG: hypothetical protein ACLVJH_12540 [Faecalibacterium prausnitzii]
MPVTNYLADAEMFAAVGKVLIGRHRMTLTAWCLEISGSCSSIMAECLVQALA